MQDLHSCLVIFYSLRAATHPAQRTHRTARHACDADRGTKIHDRLVEQVSLTGRSYLASNNPKKARGLLLGRYSEETCEHASGIGIENGCVATKGEAQHRTSGVLANAGKLG